MNSVRVVGVLIAFVALILTVQTVGAYTDCALCNRTKCENENIDTCPKDHRLTMDRCNCCKKCIHVNTPEPTRAHNPCKLIKCTKGKICLLNIQGIPMCRCPSYLKCKGKRRRNYVCAKDGKSYKSRCDLRVHECRTERRVGIFHKGKCVKKKTIQKSKSKKFSKKWHINKRHKNGNKKNKRNRIHTREKKRQQRQKRRRNRYVY